MARLARIVVPGQPHLVTQRGHGGQRAFFSDGDYQLYTQLLAENCKAANVDVLAYVLMPRHVHLVLLPHDKDGLRKALSTVHRRYATLVHQRRKRTGAFWQGRFSAVAMDDDHAAAAIAYVSVNPVRAKLVKRAADWRWSSTKALLKGKDDDVTAIGASRIYAPDFPDLIKSAPDEEVLQRFRRSESIGRPVGSHAFLRLLEKKTKRAIIPRKRGPKPL